MQIRTGTTSRRPVPHFPPLFSYGLNLDLWFGSALAKISSIGRLLAVAWKTGRSRS
jgi:hypothetical protein